MYLLSKTKNPFLKIKNILLLFQSIVCQHHLHLQNRKASMEAGTALRLHFTFHTPIFLSNPTSKPKTALTLSSPPSRFHSFTVYNFPRAKPKRDFLADWASQNDDVVRPLPIYVGTTSLFAVLFNRAISGIAPVADAGRFSISLD